MANITIDGKNFTVKDGITIIEAIDEVKSQLPRYCYHPGLSIAGNCRICQVEVDKMPGTVIACNTRVAEGMVIHTASAKAKESQSTVLEFLLANHPLDCPVCDQAGECKLQDYYMDYGVYDAKFDETKVKKTKKAKSIGPTIMLDQERCILCSRCVRFGDEITKTHDFGIFGRGHNASIDIYPGQELDNKYSGNVADICPVGALTDKDFRFKMRVWYLGKQDSICPGCSRGCNTSVQFEKSRPYHLKGDRVMRLKPRENKDVNQWWMCDEGRYAYKAIDQGRLRAIKTPKKATQWKQALEETAETLKAKDSSRWAFLASPQNTNEELFLVKKLFLEKLQWKQWAFQAPGQEGFEDNFLIRKDKNPNTAGAGQILGAPAQEMSALIEKAKKGGLDGLVIFYHDLAKVFGADALQEIRKNVKTLIYVGIHQNPTAEAADIVLPVASYAEKEGTFTNFEGRVQRIRKAVEPLAETLPDWDLLLNLLGLVGVSSKYLRPEHIFDDLAKSNEAFADMNYKKIGSQGLVWRQK